MPDRKFHSVKDNNIEAISGNAMRTVNTIKAGATNAYPVKVSFISFVLFIIQPSYSFILDILI